MSDWVLLRDHLREHLAAQIDDGIRDHPDPELRALLAYHRERLIALACDQLELTHLRRALAEREMLDVEETVVKLDRKLNGKKHHRWS
jgi:hypothetical protein